MQPMRMAGRMTLTLHPNDNVMTIVDDEVELACLRSGEACAVGIPYGHKVARRAIAEGEAVIKCGVAIGRASCSISTGEHVHVHNCA